MRKIMSRKLILFISFLMIFISGFLFGSGTFALMTTETNNNSTDLLSKKIAALSAGPIYNLDNEQLQSILTPFLQDNPSIKALRIVESIDDEVMLQFFRDEEKLIFGQSIPDRFNKLEYSKTESLYNGEPVGFIEVYVETTNVQEEKIILTVQEKNWIKNHPLIKVHNELDWPPFNFNKYGVPTGLSIEYMDLLANRIGIKVEYISGEWGALLQMAFEKELDVMLNIVKTEDRQKRLLFTGSYFKNPNAIITKTNSPLTDLESLFGKRVSFPAGFFYEEILEKKYPKIIRVPVENTLDSLKAVEFGRSDAALAELAVARHLIRENVLSDLQISGEFNSGNPETENLNIAVRNDWPELQSMLVKAMASITPEEKQALNDKWLGRQKNLEPGLVLSNEEKAWIGKKQTLIVGNENDWAPFDFNIDGEAKGYSIDYLKLLAEKTGLELTFVNGFSWTQLLDKLRNKEIDLLPAMGDTPERRKYTDFTDHYMVNPTVIVTRAGETELSGVGDLKAKKLTMVDGYYYVNKVKEDYPEIDVVPADGFLEGLQLVLRNKADAFIGSGVVVNHTIQENFLSGLQIVGRSGIDDNERFKIKIGVKKGNPLLVSILNKAIHSVSQDEKQEISNRWIKSSVVAPPTDQLVPVETFSVQKILWQGLIFLVIVSGVIGILYFLIQHYFGNAFVSLIQSNKVIWVAPILMGIFLILISIFALTALKSIEEQSRKNAGESLRGVVTSAHESLLVWVESQKAVVQRLAQDPKLQELTAKHLDVTRIKPDLLKSQTLSHIRQHFDKLRDTQGDLGFFIISKDFINIGSMRDTNIGKTNLIVDQRPVFIQKAFEGYTTFIPPLESDVKLGSEEVESSINPPTMFFAAPIKDKQGNVMAVLTLRMDPTKEFNRLVQVGKIGVSGETYAFDKTGKLISNSRFEDQLREIGLLDLKANSMLNIVLNNPGGDLTEGFKANLTKDRQSLTLMAKKATSGNSGINTHGYRDYRGIRVLGVWIWDKNLGFGFATEIDEKEALSPYYATRSIFITVLGITFILMILLTAISLWFGRKANEILIESRNELEDKVRERTSELSVEIKERKKTETELRKLFFAIEESPVMIVITDKNGSIEYVNPKFEVITKFSKEEVSGRKPNIMNSGFHPDSFFKEMWSTILAGNDWRGEIFNKDKNGNCHWDSVVISPITNTENEITHFVSIQEDITQRKHNESELRKLSQAVEQSPVSVVITKPNGEIEYVNPKFTEVTGYSQKEALGKNPRILNSGIQPKSFYKNMWDMLASGEAWQGEFCNKKKNGEIYWEQAAISPIIGNDNIITHYVAVKENISVRKKMEAELNESQQRLDLALEASNTGLWDLKPIKKELYLNDQWHRQLGYEPGRFTGNNDPFAEILHPDDREAVEKGLANYDEGKSGAYQEEMRVKTADGSYKWILAIGKIVERTASGETERIIGITSDISKRKQMEQELETNRKRLDLALEVSNTGLWDGSLISGEVYNNEQWYKQLGYQREEFDSDVDPFDHLLHPDDKKGVSEKLQDLSIGNSDIYESEFRLKAKDGSWKWILAKGKVIQRNGIGEADRFVGVHLDITERKKAEKTIKEAGDRLQTIIDGVHSLVFIKDTEGQHVLVNSFFEESFGIKREAVIGKTDLDLFSKDVAEEIMAIDARIMRNKRPETFEMTIPHQDDSFRIHLTEKFPLFDQQGTVYGLCGLATDITHQKEIEKELQIAKQDAEAATKAKSDFLANMSHEIRTPMNAIMGMTHLALETDLTPKQEDYLKKTYNSATSLLGLINDILDFSKIEAGKMDMESVDFHLDDVLNNVSTLITIKAEEQGLDLIFQTSDSIPRFLIGDSLRLGQILINLANNAVKFTAKGSVTIETSLIEESPEKYTLQFAVKDTGIGLTKEQIGKLFKSFSQADSSTTRKFGGTGLGLTISKRLVELMNGKIWVESEPDQGSSFIFTAEFGHGNEAKLKVRSSQKGFDQERLKSIQGARILLVEDNEINQQVAQEILEKAGFVIDIAEDGRQGIVAVQKKTYDLVLMDIQMPIMDGYEATKAIRKNPKFNDLPILAMSANAMTQDRDESMAAGMNDHVAKPIELQQLFAALLKWIKPGDREVNPGIRQKALGNEEKIELPDKLPGIDMKTGLRRVGGNKKLYRNLLIKFHRDNQDITEQIQKALKEKDNELAQRLAHTVKGVAGNIGAGDVQKAAEVVELAVKNYQLEEIKNMIQTLKEKLDVPMPSIKLIADAQQVDESNKGEKPNGTPDQLRALLTELEPLLKKRKPKPCKEMMEKINHFSWADKYSDLITKLNNQVSKYMFKDAIKILEDLLKQISS